MAKSTRGKQYLRNVYIEQDGYRHHQGHAVRDRETGQVYTVISFGAHPDISGLAYCLAPWNGGSKINVPAAIVQ